MVDRTTCSFVDGIWVHDDDDDNNIDRIYLVVKSFSLFVLNNNDGNDNDFQMIFVIFMTILLLLYLQNDGLIQAERGCRILLPQPDTITIITIIDIIEMIIGLLQYCFDTLCTEH